LAFISESTESRLGSWSNCEWKDLPIRALTKNHALRMEKTDLKKVRRWLIVFICGLLISGATAIPLIPELGFMYRALHHFGISSGPVHDWLQLVYAGLLETKQRYPFFQYGTDWLAFGHFVIAIAFLGAVRDPVKNIWLLQFGMIACALVIPYALVFGAIRQIPWWWRLLDCSFGAFGLIPLLLSYKLVKKAPVSGIKF
jgi:hypothetical protein